MNDPQSISTSSSRPTGAKIVAYLFFVVSYGFAAAFILNVMQ